MSFTPATMAVPQSPAAMPVAAKCAATRLLLQAVSTAAQGPVMPHVKDTRPAATLIAEPGGGRVGGGGTRLRAKCDALR